MKSELPAGPGTPDELYSRLFSNMVMQYASMAFMFMGKSPHPETGETIKDLDAAQMFISQLEMLQVKTKHNLTPQEESILKQSLMTMRLAFVESIEPEEQAPPVAAQTSPAAKASPAPPAPPSPSTSSSPDTVPPAASEPAPTPAEEDERKKFVKKY